MAQESQIQERSVEDYIPVVCNERIVQCRIEMLHASYRDSRRSGFRKHFQKREHYLTLKIIFIRDFQKILHKSRDSFLGHCIAYGMEKARLFDKMGHLVLELGVIVWGYIVEFKIRRVHCLSFWKVGDAQGLLHSLRMMIG